MISSTFGAMVMLILSKECANFSRLILKSQGTSGRASKSLQYKDLLTIRFSGRALEPLCHFSVFNRKRINVCSYDTPTRQRPIPVSLWDNQPSIIRLTAFRLIRILERAGGFHEN
jgi:hypothetical protein